MKPSIPLPPGWGSDKLTDFLDEARRNQFATFAKKTAEYRVLREIDECFLKIGENLINPKNMLSAALLFRSHSVFRTACGTSMAGQAAETFVLLRSCLEYAGYALVIFKNPPLGETWLKRHDDASSLAAVRREFNAGRVEEVITGVDARLGQVYKTLYQTSIDFGGHPNERGLSSNAVMEEADEQMRYLQIYLHGDGLALQHALKLTAQSGLCSLHIFQHVFAERFLLLGLREKLIKLRGQGL